MGSTLTVDNIVGATTAANVKLPAGSVLQTVVATEQRGSNANTTSSSYTNLSGLSCVITPKYNNSKILVQANIHIHTQISNYSELTLFRDSTNLATNSQARFMLQRGDGDPDGGNNGYGFWGMVPLSILDNPATTSATTYTIQVRKNATGSNAIYIYEGGVNTITCQEIAQ